MFYLWNTGGLPHAKLRCLLISASVKEFCFYAKPCKLNHHYCIHCYLSFGASLLLGMIHFTTELGTLCMQAQPGFCWGGGCVYQKLKYFRRKSASTGCVPSKPVQPSLSYAVGGWAQNPQLSNTKEVWDQRPQPLCDFCGVLVKLGALTLFELYFINFCTQNQILLVWKRTAKQK